MLIPRPVLSILSLLSAPTVRGLQKGRGRAHNREFSQAFLLHYLDFSLGRAAGLQWSTNGCVTPPGILTCWAEAALNLPTHTPTHAPRYPTSLATKPMWKFNFSIILRGSSPRACPPPGPHEPAYPWHPGLTSVLGYH